MLNKLALIIVVLMVLTAGITIMTSSSDAEVASHNLSKEADQFRILRRVVFYNGITDAYILEVTGYCSIDLMTNGTLKVTVKTDNGSFMKHYLGLSDNVTYFAEQLNPANVSDDRYKVVFKPSVIIPLWELDDPDTAPGT